MVADLPNGRAAGTVNHNTTSYGSQARGTEVSEKDSRNLRGGMN